MIDPTEKLRQEKQRARNKHRLEFLALLIGLGLSVEKYLQNDYRNLLGQLSHVADTNNRITSAQMGVVRAILKSTLAKTAREILHETEALDDKVASIAAQFAGGEHDLTLANELRDVLNTGALGVPLADIFTQAFFQAMMNVSGVVQRTILANQPIDSAKAEIDKAINETLRRKLVNEIGTQVNAGFNAIVQKVAIKGGVSEMIYRLSPTTEHCSWCPPHDGKIYPITHGVWGELPKHPNCICYGEPVIRSEIEQPERLRI